MEPSLPGFVAIAAGSALGGGARFLVSGWVAARIGETFPFGTLVVNVTGAFALGLLAGWVEGAPGGLPAWLWELAAVGFLGSYTTVSSFSLQTLLLARSGDGRRALVNVIASLALGLAAATLGVALGR